MLLLGSGSRFRFSAGVGVSIAVRFVLRDAAAAPAAFCRNGDRPAVDDDRPGVRHRQLLVVDVLQEAEHAAGVGGHAVVGPRREVVLAHHATLLFVLQPQTSMCNYLRPTAAPYVVGPISAGCFTSGCLRNENGRRSGRVCGVTTHATVRLRRGRLSTTSALRRCIAGWNRRDWPGVTSEGKCEARTSN